MKTLVTDTHFFINVVLDRLSPSVFKRTYTSLKQSLAEFYTILLEEHLQVGGGNLFLTRYLTRVVQLYSNLAFVLTREDV